MARNTKYGRGRELEIIYVQRIGKESGVKIVQNKGRGIYNRKEQCGKSNRKME